MSIAIKFVILFLSLGLLGKAMTSAPDSSNGQVTAAEDGNPPPPKP